MTRIFLSSTLPVTHQQLSYDLSRSLNHASFDRRRGTGALVALGARPIASGAILITHKPMVVAMENVVSKHRRIMWSARFELCAVIGAEFETAA